MDKYYEEKRILKQISARLVPPDDTYPDCVCKILMTEDFLYVLEDNFDGTYNRLFKIPFRRLLSIEKYISEDREGSSRNSDFTTRSYLVDVFTALVRGIILLSGMKKETINRSFLNIIYKDENGKKSQLFFSECNNDIKGMVDTFKKYKF